MTEQNAERGAPESAETNEEELDRRALELAETAYPGMVESAGWYPFPRTEKDGDGPCWAATLIDGRRVSGPFGFDSQVQHNDGDA